MDMSSGFTLARIRGIAIRVHWSWIVIFVLLSWSLSTGFFDDKLFEGWERWQRWTGGTFTALLFFLSVLLHELGHAFVAQHYGKEVPSITLFIFGGASTLQDEMETAGQEFRIAIAGPATSWLLAVIGVALWWALPDSTAGTIAGYLGFINFLLGAFNLLPGFPLDGGRVFRAAVWAKTGSLLRATRIASRTGSLIAWTLIGLGLITVLFAGLPGLWYVLIGLFLKSAAEGAYEQMVIERALEDVQASTVMRPPPVPIEEEWTLDRIVNERILSRAERVVFVQRGDAVTGLISTSDLARTSRRTWGETRAGDIMVKSADAHVVAPGDSLLDAMRLMRNYDVHQIPVVEAGRLLGVITRADLLEQIELRLRFDRDGHSPQ